jgi:hypothetical protein
MKNKLIINSKVSLIEIVFSTLIFAVAGIIMIKSFAYGRYTQIMANDKVRAGAIAQSVAEMIKASNSVEELNNFLDTSFTKNKNSYVEHFDKDWNLSDENQEYELSIILSEEKKVSGDLVSISIFIEKNNNYPFMKKGEHKLVYSIETKKFFPHGGAYGE